MRIDLIDRKDKDPLFGIYESTIYPHLLVAIIAEPSIARRRAVTLADKYYGNNPSEAWEHVRDYVKKVLGGNARQLPDDDPRAFDLDSRVLDGLYLYSQPGLTPRHLYDFFHLSFRVTARIPDEGNKTVSRSIDKWGLEACLNEVLAVRARYLASHKPGSFYFHQLCQVIRFRMFELKFKVQLREDPFLCDLSADKQEREWAKIIMSNKF